MKWFAKNYYIEKSWLGNIECKFDGYNNFGNRRAANKWRLLMITQEENLKSIIEEIKNNKIMLPDFQRQFDWNIEKQIGLVASVLTKLPVGGILLLEADSKDYKSKRIGLDSKEKIVGEIPQKTNFLLDGQQRMTCLTNVFSDVIHEASEKKVSRLAARQLLATRFYLKINRWDVNIVSESSKDLFGIRTLDFRFDVSNGEEPDFLTADITDYIECRPFLASEYDEKPYMPGQRYDDKLDDYCFATPGIYLIPLYLLVGSGSKDDKLRKKRLLAIIKRMRDQITESISTYHFNLDVEARQEFAFSIIIDSLDRKKYSDASDKDEKFESLIIEKAELWEDYFQKYLYSCIEKMKLNKIEMPEGSRARAIDIYENMNMGGLSLSTLDLVAARVAKVSRESLYDRISKCLINNKKYNEAAFPKEIRRYIPLNYNASTKIKAVDTRASKSCSGLFLEVLGLYCNNKNYDPAEAKCAYSKSSQILKLSEEEIDSNCEKVCIAMDRAFAFLQIRCGVQSLSDVNYKLMIRLIAYIFTNDKWYGSEKVHDIIEAWYWAAIFSGEYDKDQNERFEKNLRSILETLTTKAKKYDWIITLKNNIFETPYFSDCSFLLMEKANEDRIPKEHLAKYICQFYLSRTYSDLIHDDRQINVFSKYKLEKHHIVPVGSVSKIGESTDILRKDKTNIVNSPLNYVFISDATNLEISNISLKEYEQDITASAKAALNIVNYPSVEKLNDKTTIKAWLKERYKILKGQIQNRVMNMLLS